MHPVANVVRQSFRVRPGLSVHDHAVDVAGLLEPGDERPHADHEYSFVLRRRTSRLDEKCTRQLRVTTKPLCEGGVAHRAPVVVRPGNAGCETNLADLAGVDGNRIGARLRRPRVHPMKEQRLLLESVPHERVNLRSFGHANQGPGICSGLPSTANASTFSPGSVSASGCHSPSRASRRTVSVPPSERSRCGSVVVGGNCLDACSWNVSCGKRCRVSGR